MRGIKAKALRRAVYNDLPTNAAGRRYAWDDDTLRADPYRRTYQVAKVRMRPRATPPDFRPTRSMHRADQLAEVLKLRAELETKREKITAKPGLVRSLLNLVKEAGS